MTVIACLHTAFSNVAVFDAACPPGVRLTHAVRPDLLAEAEGCGMDEALAGRTALVLWELAHAASAVLLTCSTLGAAVGRSGAGKVPILRADAALAETARRVGGRLVVLCAAPTTLQPTRDVFDDGSGQLDLRLVAGAWPLFQAGDLPGYRRHIAEAADAAFADGAAVVALAQASMAGAAALCRAGTPLTSPTAGLMAALRACP